MLPVLQVGPFAIQFPGLMLIAGSWVAYLLMEREARRNGLPVKGLGNMCFYALVAGVIGARLGYAIRYADIYLSDPAGLVSLNPNTLSLHEGILIGLLVAFLYGNRKGLPLLPTLDALAPSLALFAIFIGVAHLASGDAFGAITNLPWGIELWGAVRHPSQIYEIVLATVVFLIILRLRQEDAFDGFLFLVYLSLASLSALFLGSFRGDSLIILGAVRQDQLVALVVLLGSLISLHILARRAEGEGGMGAQSTRAS